MSELRGQYVVLRPPEAGDIPFFYEVRNNIALQHALMAHPTKNSVADVRAWFDRRLSESDTVFYVIADGQLGSPCGFIQLIKIDELHRHAWLGICLSEEQCGKSYAKEALQLLEEYSLSTLHLNKIQLEVLSNNARAISFYLHNGYREVGLLQKHHNIESHYYDVTLMEKLLGQE